MEENLNQPGTLPENTDQRRVELPPIEVGKPEPPAEPKEIPSTNMFAPIGKEEPSTLGLAGASVTSGFYNSLGGSLLAKAQNKFGVSTDPRSVSLDDYDIKLVTADKLNASGRTLTPAQLAELKYNDYPRSGGVGEKIAEEGAFMAGAIASPETLAFPVFKGGSAALTLAAEKAPSLAPVAEKYLPGLAARMVDTGGAMAYYTFATNPIVQTNRVAAGLQPEVDYGRVPVAALEAFVGGALLHGGIETSTLAAKFGSQAVADSNFGKGFRQRLYENVFGPFKLDEIGARGVGEEPANMSQNISDMTPPPAEDMAGVTGDVSAAPVDIAASTRVTQPQTLLGFIRGQGGIKDWKGELKSQDMHRRYPGLVNNNKGLELDHAREIAEEAGYLQEGSTPDDLVQALLSNEPVYSLREIDQAHEFKAQQQAREYEKSVGAARKELSSIYDGYGVQKEILDDAAHYMAMEGYSADEAIAQATEDLSRREPLGEAPIYEDAHADILFRDPSLGGPRPTFSPTGGAIGDQTVLSLQQQSMALADALGIPLRQGRVQKGAAGQWESRYGEARVKQIPDFYTVAHESGHAIEQQVGPELTNIIRLNAGEMGGFAPGMPPSEGFGEWMVSFLTNPGDAASRAPNFTAAFENLLNTRNPELFKSLMDAAETYKAFAEATADQRVAATLVPVENEGWFKGLVKAYKKDGLAATIGRVLADGYVGLLDDRAGFTRVTRDLARLIYESNGHNLVDLKAAENPDILKRLYADRYVQGVIYQMRHGRVPYRGTVPEGPSMHDILSTASGASPLLGRWDQKMIGLFDQAIYNRRALVLYDEYDAAMSSWRSLPAAQRTEFNKPKRPLPLDRSDYQAAYDNVTRSNPQFLTALDMWQENIKLRNQKLFDAGIIDKELFDTLQNTPFYAPVFRDMSDKALAREGAGGVSSGGPGITNVVKKRKGSERDVISPIQSVMLQDFLIEKTIRQNDVVLSLVNLAKRAGLGAGKYVAEVPAQDVKRMTFDIREGLEGVAKKSGISGADLKLVLDTVNNVYGNDPIFGEAFSKQFTGPNGEPIVFYKEGGQVKAVYLMSGKEGQAIYEHLMSMPQPIQDIGMNILSAAGTLQRAGIVFDPTFIVSNLIRDQLAAGILRRDYIPFLSGAKGVISEMTQDEAAQLYGYLGGVGAGSVITDAHLAATADIDAIANKSWMSQHLNPRALTFDLRAMMGVLETSQVTEAGTRNSIMANVYKQKLKQGLTPYEAGFEAAAQAHDFLDFSRHGSLTRQINALTPFLNANYQGLDKARRAMIEPLAKKARGDILTQSENDELNNAYLSWIKMGVGTSALGVALASMFWDDERYRDADKSKEMIIPWGDTVVRLPKPFELGLFMTAGELAYAGFAQKDPRAAGNLMAAIRANLTPPIPVIDNPLVKTYYEQATGHNLFTGRNIVPDNKQKFERTPELQVTERTPYFAKVLANTLNTITYNETGKMLGFEKPWSPIKIEQMFGSAFGTAGRDFMSASNWLSQGDDALPNKFENQVFLRRFMLDPTKNSDTIRRYFDHVSKATGDYNQISAAYNEVVERDPAAAASILAKQKADLKAFVILGSGGDELTGKAAFSADEKLLHPITRARNAVGELSAILGKLSENTQSNSATGEYIEMTPRKRRQVIDAIQEMSAMEMRNALVLTQEPGYADRQPFDMNDKLEVIRSLSPEIAADIEHRYAQKKVYKTSEIAKYWPSARQALLREGSQANLIEPSMYAKVAGYEFNGVRGRKQRKQRAPIPGEGATAP